MTGKEMYLEAMRLNDSGDHEGFLATMADDVVWVVPGGGVLEGKEALRGWLGAFWTAFSSFRHDIDRIVEEGDTLFVEGRWTGTNDGPLTTPDGSQLPPTGREVTFRWAMTAERNADDLCSRAHIYFDQMEMLGQLGLLPEPVNA